jgi:orotidine-5'-phosphate decarboxylase
MKIAERLGRRSLIPACDVGVERYEDIVQETSDLPQVGAFKIGASLALSVGMRTVVRIAREYTDKPLIYDHQKAGTDLPDTAEVFMSALSDAGIDAIILFPMAGPTTQTTWTRAATERGIDVLVGGYMTHPDFLSQHGGYIPDSSVERIYRLAARSGVVNFVVPGTDLDALTRIRAILAEELDDPVLYSPGFAPQGGRLSEATRVAGDRWHAIIGRGIYEQPDVRRSVEELAAQL